METENPIDKRVDKIKNVVTTSKTVTSFTRALGYISLAFAAWVFFLGFMGGSKGDLEIAIPSGIGLSILGIIILVAVKKK